MNVVTYDNDIVALEDILPETLPIIYPEINKSGWSYEWLVDSNDEKIFIYNYYRAYRGESFWGYAYVGIFLDKHEQPDQWFSTFDVNITFAAKQYDLDFAQELSENIEEEIMYALTAIKALD